MFSTMLRIEKLDAKRLESLKAFVEELTPKKNGIMRLSMDNKIHYDYTERTLISLLGYEKAQSVISKLQLDTANVTKEQQEISKTILEYDETPYDQWKNGALFKYAILDEDTKTLMFSFYATMMNGIKIDKMTVELIYNNNSATVIFEEKHTQNDSTKEVTIHEFLRNLNSNYEYSPTDTLSIVGTVYTSSYGNMLPPISVKKEVNVNFSNSKNMLSPNSIEKDGNSASSNSKVKSIKVLNPVIKKAGHTVIKIGLGRGPIPGDSSDLDYHYDSYREMQLENNGKICLMNGVSVNIGNTQGECIICKSPAGVSISSKKFTYEYTEGENYVTYALTKDWGVYAPWSSGDLCDITNNITMYDLKDIPISVVITSVENTTVPEGIGYIERISRLEFFWGCLIENTQIMMRDGNTKSVQEVMIGDIVLSGDRKLLKVVNIWTGGEEKPCILMRTEQGKEITATSQHPFWCKDKFIQVGDIQVGDKVDTIDGTEIISEIKFVSYDKTVYNFDLECLEKIDEVGNKITLIADGFIVGDNQMQGKCIKAKNDSM